MSPLKRDNMGHEISDEIFEEALREIKGYVDITIDDLKKIQEIAHRHARGKPGLTPAPVKMSWKDYFSKLRGGSKSPPGFEIAELLWAWFGSAIAVGVGFYLS